MNLQEFVAITLLNVVNGVSDARKQLGEQDKDHIAPSITTHHQILHDQGRVLSNNKVIHFVEFDVAVTVTTSTNSAAPGTVGVVSDTGSMEYTSANTGYSRVKFSVPITLPLASR